MTLTSLTTFFIVMMALYQHIIMFFLAYARNTSYLAVMKRSKCKIVYIPVLVDEHFIE